MRKPFTWVIILMVLALLLMQGQLWLSSTGVWAIISVHRQIAMVDAQNQKLLARNNHQIAKIEAFKHGDFAIETAARTELGMIRKDEVFYQVVES